MKKNNLVSIVLTVLVASAAIIGGTYALRGYNTEKNSPEKTVKDFYAEWTGYEGSPVADRIFEGSLYVSREFTERTNALLDSFGPGGFDPVLCAQDIPAGINITGTTIDGDKAAVIVEELFSGGNKNVEVKLRRENGRWAIADIVCLPGENRGADLDTASPAIKNLVGDHIRENLNKLSPVKAVLGGTFHLGSIRFTGPTTCIVDYEDGHIALTADVQFGVAAAGEVEIISFTVREDAGPAAFRETGNLTGSGTDWNLIYEKPGQPALLAELQFNENSRCQDAYSDKSCSPVYWQAGNRADVSGRKEGDFLFVTSLRIIGEDSKTISGDNGAGGSFCEDTCGNRSCEEIVCLAEGCPCAETPSTCPQDCR